jgi:ABC-type lipoprotein release transport system permease subunit
MIGVIADIRYALRQLRRAPRGAMRRVRAFLYGTSLYDPLAYMLVAALVLHASAGAIAIPARRAARIDPMEALRCE